MTQTQKTQFKENGFWIFETWKLFLLIISLITPPAIGFGVMQNNIIATKEKVEKLEIWKEKHRDEVDIVRAGIEKQLSEIQMNLRFQMEKQGLKYQELTR